MSVSHCHHSKTCWDLFSTITFSLTWLSSPFCPWFLITDAQFEDRPPASHICINYSPYFFLGPTADSLSKVVHYNTVGFHLTTSAVKPFVFPDYHLLMWCASVIHQYQYNVQMQMKEFDKSLMGWFATLRYGMLPNTNFFDKCDPLIATHYCVWVSELVISLFAVVCVSERTLLMSRFFGKPDSFIVTHYCVWVSELLFASDNTRRKRMLVM